MTTDQIRAVQNRQPFQPFELRMADGNSIAVRHREFLTLSPQGRTIVVFEPDDSMHIVDLLVVTDLHVLPPANRPSANGE